ncbi:MAG: hypothetical protein WAQ27_02885 [Candidatus Microsaccharimonas sp.]
MKRRLHRWQKLALASLGVFVVAAVTYVVLATGVISLHPATIAGCRTTDGIEVCLELSKTEAISASEDITVKVRVTNTTNDSYKTTFSCTDTSARVVVNGQDGGSVCGMAFTDYVLPAGKSRTDTHTINGANLNEGQNKLVGVWANARSEPVSVSRLAIASGEASQQLNACQAVPDNPESDDIPGYCQYVQVMLDSPKGDEYTCAFWKDFIAKVELNIPCDNGLDLGVGWIYLPEQYSQQYKEKIQVLDGVEEVIVP